MDQPLLLVPKILPFPKELELHLFSISIQEFLCVSTPLWDPEKWTNSFSFLRNTYKIRHYKKDNGNPTINYFIYEFHSNRNTCPTETEFVTCYPLAEQAKIYLRGKDDSFESTWESNYIALHCRNPCCIFERGWPPCFSHGTILFPPSPLSPRSTETKCRTGANSSSRKKGLTEPGSLTNTNLILI